MGRWRDPVPATSCLGSYRKMDISFIKGKECSGTYSPVYCPIFKRLTLNARLALVQGRELCQLCF
jgi:hypothetical protein